MWKLQALSFLSEASQTYGKMHDQIIKLQRMILSKLKKTTLI